MTVSRQDLVEIRALTYELGKSTEDVLEHIKAVQDHVAPQLVAFVDIPKTGGKTVTSMFTAAYSNAAVRDAGNYLKSPERVEAKISRLRVARARVTTGRIPYGFFREHLPKDTRFVTFLRQPVERVVSHYYRSIHRTGTALDERRPVTADSIEEALESGLPPLTNLATRLLCRDPSPSRDLPPKALDDAKENLRAFEFVGIQERLAESMLLLQRALGLDLVAYEEQLDDSDTVVEEISNEQRALIEECNQLDLELYTFALGLFEDAVAAADQQFEVDVETLRGLSAARTEEALQAAREWLDRELSAGTTKPLAALRAAARPAGISLNALERASQLLAVERQRDDDGQWIWTRTRGGLDQVAP
jgi:hypothetical protein